jgi:hypothetical protein
MTVSDLRTPPNRRAPTRHRRRRTFDDVGQQALLLVMAITLIMASFALVMVTQTTQEFPVVDHTLVDHAAYRALQAGVNDYLYAINENPNGVTCTSASAPSCAYFNTQGFQFDQFTSVPNTPTGQTGVSYAPSEWTSVGYPVLNQAAGTIQVAVVGAAGFANAASSIQYQTADIVFKAANTFLLNVSWSQYNAIDPNINGVGSGCTPTSYLWGSGNCGTGDAGTVTPSFPYYGPVFSDDEVLVCNTPTIQQIETAAPNLTYASPGCNNNVTYINPSKNLSINPYPLSPPTNINALSTPAKSQGCYYTGPTTITFLSTGGYYVSSPDTVWQASNGTTNTTYDASSTANNKSQCLPTTSGSTAGNVSGPSNGVIYVTGVTGTGCNSTLQRNDPNPLYAAYDANGFNYDGEGSSSQCNGDAIVSGAVSGAYTLATANDIMIDGNLTYADCPQLSSTQQNAMNSATPLGEWPTSAQCSSISTTTVNDTLGLIATNFVSINNPLQTVRGRTQALPTCGSGSASPAPDCSNPDPIIMASILALQHTFSVPNFCSSPGYMGSVDLYGSLGEKYIDVEECGSNGYGVSYTWDSRLSILSPPEFFTPATPSWDTNSFSVTVGQCSVVWPINTSTCPTAP